MLGIIPKRLYAMLKKDLRVWGVWDGLTGRLEYVSASQADCRHVIELYRRVHRIGVELLRFDLSPLCFESLPSGALTKTLTQNKG